jgi:hypothetical protein
MNLQTEFSNRYRLGIDVTDTLPEGVKKALVAWIDYDYENLPISVSVVDCMDSYANISEMFADIQKQHLSVSSLFCTHPLWDEITNQKFRAIHDYNHHFKVGLHSDFSLYGEFQAYIKAVADFDIWLSAYGASYLPFAITVQKILFSEIVLQASVRCETGEFAAQKIVF